MPGKRYRTNFVEKLDQIIKRKNALSSIHEKPENIEPLEMKNSTQIAQKDNAQENSKDKSLEHNIVL